MTDQKEKDEIRLTWEEFREKCRDLALLIKGHLASKKFTGIYGIPRGGCYVALELANILGLPLVEKQNIEKDTLIADDILDSGKTLSQFPENWKAVLFLKNVKRKFDHSLRHLFAGLEIGNTWVHFSWELTEVPAQDSVVRMFQVIGENPVREGLLETPRRVFNSWKKIYGGYSQDPAIVLKTVFEDVNNYDQMIALTDIEMYSTCEHHLLPFVGRAHVAYLPQGKVVGLSKLARLVEVFSRRLQIQERLTQQIAEAVQQHLNPLGVGVIIQAKHLCMMARGVEKQNSEMTTSCLMGNFKTDPTVKDEFLKLCLKS